MTCANNASYPIRGVDKILITISDGSNLCLPDVLYIPGVKKNLLSVSSLAKNGLRVIFEDDKCVVRDRESGYSLITGTLENGLFVLNHYEKQIQVCIAETKTRAMHDAELWHAGFGHVGYGSLMTFQRHNMVHDLFYWVYPLKAKSDVFAIFQHHVAMVENETGFKVQTLCADQGGEYMSGAFKDFLGKKGIKHQCTMPYTPQQNGVAERKNRSLMEMARCMFKAKSLPHKLWIKAVACAAHVLNRCPTCALKTITPYEACYVGSLMIRQSNVYLWGTVVEVKVIDFTIPLQQDIESRDVILAKTAAQPMVAFDVPHMQTQDVFEGLLPSFVEHQESQKVDNLDQFFD
ncbi:hypothetical protein L7F22_055201 [Adiantum nelumboides]|nr:hypothetical protein [Adiantum nelumboides]